MCFSVKTRSCLLENTKRTRKYSLQQFSTKITRAELVNTPALFAGRPVIMVYFAVLPVINDILFLITMYEK